MNKDNELIWEKVSEEHIVRDEFIDFRKSAYRFPNGEVFEPFYSYSRRDYVVIVARDEDGRYICVRQFRQGLERVTTEFPAGGIERDGEAQYARNSDKAAEDALDAARRELSEETGYTADKWTHLGTFPANPTIADNYAHLFYASGCTKVSELSLDDTEFLNVDLFTREEIDEMVKNGEFPQPIHVLGMLLADKV